MTREMVREMSDNGEGKHEEKMIVRVREWTSMNVSVRDRVWA